MHTQRWYATCPQGMSKKREEKRCIPKEGMPHTHKECQKKRERKREKENIAHTKNITREREFI